MTERSKTVKERKSVDSIISPEDHVRFHIYSGDIPLENGGVEILKMLIKHEGELRTLSNDTYKIWVEQRTYLLHAVNILIELQNRPWWKKLLGLS